MTPQFTSKVLAAGEALSISAHARVLTVKKCTLPITVAFDGGPGTPCTSGSVFDQGFRTLNFINVQLTSVTLEFWVADTKIDFSPADNSAANAATYFLGQCGIDSGGVLPNAGGTTTAITILGSGYMQIPNAPNILIAATNNGHRRQFVIFAVATGSPSLNVLDAAGRVFLVVLANQVVQITSDADIYVSGVASTCSVSIGQVFLLQN